MVTGYGKALLGGCYGRYPLTHEELEASDFKSVTEEITAEEVRRKLFSFENPNAASGYVASWMETTGSPTVLSCSKPA